MKVIKNSTEVFLTTLERQAVRREDKKIVEILDKELYDNVYIKYKNGKIKFQDHKLEVAKAVGGDTSVKFLDEADNKTTGIRNIAQAKLPADEYFCPVALSMLGIDSLADETDATLQAAEYATIDTLNAVANALLDVIVNTTEYLYRELPTSAFVGLNGQGSLDAPKGCIGIDNPTIIKPQQRMEVNLKSGQAMPANTAVKFIFHGTRTTPVGK